MQETIMAWISDFVYKWNPIMKIRGVTLPSIETQHQQLETPSCCFQIQTLLSRERWKKKKTCFAKRRDSVGSPPLVLVTMQKFRKWIKSPNDAWLRAMTPITNLSDEQETQTTLPHNYCLDDPRQYSVVARVDASWQWQTRRLVSFEGSRLTVFSIPTSPKTNIPR